MSIIDRAKTHFESLGINLLKFQNGKMKMAKQVLSIGILKSIEKNKLFKKSDNLSDVSILADIVVMKALDKDGKKILN